MLRSGHVILYPTAVLAVGRVEEQQGIIGGNAPQASSAAIGTRVGEVRCHFARTVLQRHVQPEPGACLVRLTQAGRSDDMAQHRDVVLLVAERRVGIVEIFPRQLHEVGVHGTVHSGGVHHCRKAALRFLQRNTREDVQKIGQRLFGDFRTGNERSIAEVEALPVVRRQVGSTRLGGDEQRGDVGQCERRFGTARTALRFCGLRSASGKQRQERQQQQHNGGKPTQCTRCAGTAGVAAVMAKGAV